MSQLEYSAVGMRPAVPACRGTDAAWFQLLGDDRQRDVDGQLGLGSVGRGAIWLVLLEPGELAGSMASAPPKSPHHGPASHVSRATAIPELFLL